MVKQRSPIAVFFLSFLTLGIYAWYWLVKTKGELNAAQHENPHIPTAWIWLIPFVGTIWWAWRYSESVEKYTHKECSQVISFILMLLLNVIGYAVLQYYFNQHQGAERHSA